MKRMQTGAANEKGSWLKPKSGKIFFSRDAERKFYFFVSLILFLVGFGFKIGVLR